MIFVDSSVWIDFFNHLDTPQTALLVPALRRNTAFVGDLVLAEVLQGLRDERQAARIERLLGVFPRLSVCDHAVAVLAARNYRILRARGITVRKTIDTLIATRCIIDGHALLFSDRDFEPFVAHLGLVDAMRITS